MKPVIRCENCGGKLPRGFRRWCDKPDCRGAADRCYKKQMRDAWARTGGTRRVPTYLKPPYNERLCDYCHEQLGRTWNVRRHKDCVAKASHLIGIDWVNH